MKVDINAVVINFIISHDKTNMAVINMNEHGFNEGWEIESIGVVGIDFKKDYLVKIKRPTEGLSGFSNNDMYAFPKLFNPKIKSLDLRYTYIDVNQPEYLKNDDINISFSKVSTNRNIFTMHFKNDHIVESYQIDITMVKI